MGRSERFAIIGGGIGGLSLAIAMQRKGFQVTVYENAAAIKPLGAGLGLGANAIKAFTEIGIGDDVIRAGAVIKGETTHDEHINRQVSLSLATEQPAVTEQQQNEDIITVSPQQKRKVIKASDDELAAHQAMLEKLQSASGGQCVWLKSS